MSSKLAGTPTGAPPPEPSSKPKRRFKKGISKALIAKKKEIDTAKAFEMFETETPEQIAEREKEIKERNKRDEAQRLRDRAVGFSYGGNHEAVKRDLERAKARETATDIQIAKENRYRVLGPFSKPTRTPLPTAKRDISARPPVASPPLPSVFKLGNETRGRLNLTFNRLARKDLQKTKDTSITSSATQQRPKNIKLAETQKSKEKVIRNTPDPTKQVFSKQPKKPTDVRQKLSVSLAKQASRAGRKKATDEEIREFTTPIPVPLRGSLPADYKPVKGPDRTKLSKPAVGKKKSLPAKGTGSTKSKSPGFPVSKKPGAFGSKKPATKSAPAKKSAPQPEPAPAPTRLNLIIGKGPKGGKEYWKPATSGIRSKAEFASGLKKKQNSPSTTNKLNKKDATKFTLKRMIDTMPTPVRDWYDSLP